MDSFPREGSTGSGRSGFILPMAMFILLVLSVLALGAYFIANQETLMGSATKNAELAFYVSERGAVDVMAGWDGDTYGALNAFGSTTTTDTVADGIYVVTITRTSGNMYLLDSESFITAGGELRQGASRRIGYVVRAISPDIDVFGAALTTRGNTVLSGTATVTGADEVPAALSSVCLPITGTTEPGVLTTDASAVSVGGTATLLGDPAKYQSASLDTTDFTSPGGALSWTELTGLATYTLSGGSYTTAPDTTSSGLCTQSTTSNWGNPSNPTGACGLYFPVIYVNGDARLLSGSIGQGILLVEDDLTIDSGSTFYGVIIAQGNVTLNGSATVYGTMIVKNKDSATNTIGGTSYVAFSECAINRAIAYSTSGVGFPLDARAWIDLTTASY